ncbi:nuclear transport factor 2 family protein [Emcibacter sp. SYSU 3D8]|uniref:nuclear transport factor 2 family protein n=1 Tax=Emcibacter sp. SYSU 3D8 TaxID=3133969 RepID=UPI0031FE8117
MTLDELLAIEEVKQVRHLFSHYFDGRMLGPLVDLFTNDAVCEFGPVFGGEWIGKDQIRARFEAVMGQPGMAVHGAPYSVLHAITNPWIRVLDDTTASGRWYLLDLHTAVGVENPLILFGIYDDTYRKVEGRWLIHRTRIDFLWPRRDVKADRQDQA